MTDTPTRVWWQNFSGYSDARPAKHKPLQEYKDFPSRSAALDFQRAIKAEMPEAVTCIGPVVSTKLGRAAK